LGSLIIGASIFATKSSFWLKCKKIDFGCRPHKRCPRLLAGFEEGRFPVGKGKERNRGGDEWRRSGTSIEIIMAALCNRAGHYIFALWFLSIFYLSFFLA